MRATWIAAKRPIALTAGPDAHSAIGFHLFGDDLGNSLLSVKVDPYTDIFRIARLHVLADKPLDRDSLLAAIKGGKFFIGFDVLGDSRGFSFSASGPKLQIHTPLASRIALLRNGEKLVETANSTEFAYDATKPGEYRVEVYREGLGADFDNIPWILSNPIYVK